MVANIQRESERRGRGAARQRQWPRLVALLRAETRCLRIPARASPLCRRPSPCTCAPHTLCTARSSACFSSATSSPPFANPVRLLEGQHLHHRPRAVLYRGVVGGFCGRVGCSACGSSGRKVRRPALARRSASMHALAVTSSRTTMWKRRLPATRCIAHCVTCLLYQDQGDRQLSGHWVRRQRRGLDTHTRTRPRRRCAVLKLECSYKELPRRMCAAKMRASEQAAHARAAPHLDRGLQPLVCT